MIHQGHVRLTDEMMEAARVGRLEVLETGYHHQVTLDWLQRQMEAAAGVPSHFLLGPDARRMVEKFDCGSGSAAAPIDGTGYAGQVGRPLGGLPR